MSRKLPLAEIASVAEGELLSLGRACNALTLKIRRVLGQAPEGFSSEAGLRQVLHAAGRMADAFEQFVSARNEAADGVRGRTPEPQGMSTASEPAMEGPATPPPESEGPRPPEEVGPVASEAAGATAEPPSAEQPPEQPVSEPAEELETASQEPEFSGHSDLIPLGEVLDFIGYTRKTGSLRVFGQDETLIVEFEQGDVVAACSDRPPEGTRLGEMLVARGLVEAGTIQTMVAGEPPSPARLGDRLRGAGLIDAETLQEVLADQIQGVFARLVGMQDVQFFFRSRRTFGATRTQIRLNAHQLLLEGLRQRDTFAARA